MMDQGQGQGQEGQGQEQGPAQHQQSTDQSCNKCKLSVMGVLLAAGLTWGLAVFFMAVINMYLPWGGEWIKLFGSMYLGFEATWQGAFIGLGWGFVDAAIAGLIFALIYNFVVRKCCR